MRGWTIREQEFKEDLIDQARIRSGDRVMDLGCGTGSLTLLAKTNKPDAEFVGVDADSEVLELAVKRMHEANLKITFERNLSTDLSAYQQNSFDCVLSSLFFHQLTPLLKQKTIKEVLRILKHGGEFHIADWGKASNVFMRAAFLGVQFREGFERTSDHVRGHLPVYLFEGGFEDIKCTQEYSTMFGTLALYRARKPPLNVLEL